MRARLTYIFQGDELVLAESDSEDEESGDEVPELDSDEDFDGIENEEDEEHSELAEINAGIPGTDSLKIDGSSDTAVEDENDKPNYIITKDANGGERYEYEEIG